MDFSSSQDQVRQPAQECFPGELSWETVTQLCLLYMLLPTWVQNRPLDSSPCPNSCPFSCPFLISMLNQAPRTASQ